MRKLILIAVGIAVIAVLAVFGFRYYQSHRITSDMAEAEDALRNGQYGEAARIFRAVWERDSQNVKAISGLIESLYYQRQFHEVLQMYQKAQNLPGVPPKLVTLKAWAELNLADINVDQRDRWFDQAKASFEAAVVRDSRNAEAYVGRGLVALEESNLDLSSPMTGFRPLGPYVISDAELATKQFQRALELSPKHVGALRGLAIIAHSEGRTQDVIELFESIGASNDVDVILTRSLIHLGIDPTQAEPIRDLVNNPNVIRAPSPSQRALQFCVTGVADYLLGDLDAAQRNLLTAVRNDPGFRFPAIRLHLAKVEEARGNWGAGRDKLEDLRKQRRFRREPSLLFLLALNAYRRGGFSEMDWLLEEVQRLRPNAPDVLLFRASQEPNEIDRRDLYRRVLEVDAGNFVARYNLGVIRLRLEDARAAVEDFKVALQARPDFLDAQLNLANALRQARQYEKAAEGYEQVLERLPDLDEAKLGLALVLLDQREREKAVELLEQVTREGALGALAQLLLARGAIDDGDVSSAVEHARRAVSLDPGSYQARTFLGNLYLEMDQPENAIPHFEEASKNPKNPSFPDAVNGLAVAYYLQKKYAEANEQLDRLLRREGDWGNTAAFYVNRGNVNFRKDRLEEAESDYTTAQERDRASGLASYNLGVLKERLRDWEQARFHYREAIRRQPSLAWAHLNLGNLYTAINDREAAMEEYRKASEDAPELDEAYVNLAIQLIEGGQYSEAVEYLERAAERSPRSTVIHNALAIIRLQQGDLDEAESECSRSLESDPLNSTARLLNGLVRMSQGRYSDAADILTTVSPIQKMDLSLRSALGITRVRLGNVRAGIQDMENAVELARGSARGKRFLSEGLVNLAWALLHAGEYGRASVALREALSYTGSRPPEVLVNTLKKLEMV